MSGLGRAAEPFARLQAAPVAAALLLVQELVRAVWADMNMRKRGRRMLREG